MKGTRIIVALFLLTGTSYITGCTQSGEKQRNPCLGVDCSGHGVCKVEDGKPFCECFMGYKDQDLKCIEDEDSELVELSAQAETENDEAERQAELQEQEAQKVRTRGSVREAWTLVSLLDGAAKQLQANMNDCDEAAGNYLAYWDEYSHKAAELAEWLPGIANDVDTDKKMEEVRKLMKGVETSITKLTMLMGSLKNLCPEAAARIARVMSNTQICAFNPGDGKPVKCLEPQKW